MYRTSQALNHPPSARPPSLAGGKHNSKPRPCLSEMLMKESIPKWKDCGWVYHIICHTLQKTHSLPLKYIEIIAKSSIK